MRPAGRWVYSGSLCSFGCDLSVVGLIRDRWQGLWVDMGAPRGLLGSFGVVRLIRVRPSGHLGCRGCHCVHSRSLGSFGCALGDDGLIPGD